MSASAYPTSEETTNANRRNRLLLGPCTDLLRDVLRHEVPPNTFSTIFKQKEKNIPRLNAEQKKLLYPVSGSYTGNYDDMDISLLYILIRNITNIQSHNKGWGNEPELSDNSISANIERIRIERNHCVHSPDTSVSNAEFNLFWSKCEIIVVVLDNYLGNGGFYKRETDNLKHVAMDPVLDKKIRKEIERQANEERTVKDSFRKDVKKLEDTLTMRIQELESRFDAYARETIKAKRLMVQERVLLLWEEKDLFFVEPHAFSSLIDKIHEQSITVFLGGPGCGKKSMMRHVALFLRKNNDFQILPIENVEDMETFFEGKQKQLYVLANVTGVWALDEEKMETMNKMSDTIQAILGKNSKLFFTCQSVVLKEAEHKKKKIHFLSSENIVDLESTNFALNSTDRKNIFKNYCEKKALHIEYDIYEDIFESPHSAMFPSTCSLFFSQTKFYQRGTKFFLYPKESIMSIINDIKNSNRIRYVAMVICALNGNTLSLESHKTSKYLTVKTEVCNSCKMSNNIFDIELIDELSAMKGIFFTECEGLYQFSDMRIHDLILHHYSDPFQSQILVHMPVSFLSYHFTIEETDSTFNTSSEEFTKITVWKNNYTLLAERFVKEIENMNLFDVFKSDILRNRIFLKEFINVLKTKSHQYICRLFLSVPPMQETAKKITWLYPHFKVISWVIFYGHLKILKLVVNSVVSCEGRSFSSHELPEVFGYEKEDKVRMLKLACFNGNVKLYSYIVKFVGISSLGENPSTTDEEIKIKYELEKEKDEVDFYAVGYTPMTAACLCGHLPLVKQMLFDMQEGQLDIEYSLWELHGNPINGKYKDGRTPLLAAIESGNVMFVNDLISLGADIDFMVPLYTAMTLRHSKIEELLIEKGADLTKVWELASQKGDIDTCQRVNDFIKKTETNKNLSRRSLLII